jgi:RNA polymerase-binding transcription factor
MAKNTRTTGAGKRTEPTGLARRVVAAAASKAKIVAKKKAKPPTKAVKPAARTTKAAAKATKTTKPPAKTAKKATKAAKTTKAKATKAPAKTAKTAKKVVKKPVKATKAPAKATKTAKKVVKKPVKATKAPAKAAKPAKPLKPALVPKPAPSRPVLSEVVARKHRSPAVAASTLERLRVQLIDELAQHVRQAEGLQAEAEALANEREPGDTQFDEESGEGDTLSVERERDLALSASARQTVEDITKALARMDDGSYGYCEVCGDRIPVPRLEAIPWADQCVKCKSRGERRR